MSERHATIAQPQTTSTASASAVRIQRAMTVGFAHDPAEHEADAVADRVMRMPEPGFIQRKCAACSDEEKIHRMPAAAFIQRSGRGDGFETSPEIASAIEARRGGGSPLPAPTKSFMESRFGTDFSDVRVHTDGAAVQLSRDLNAQAFTVGNDIFFNSGKFSPESSDGKHLLAHELTHTVQQGNTLVRKIQRAFRPGTCCNNSVEKENEWALVSGKETKAVWKLMPPGQCIGDSILDENAKFDCEGITCGGAFYKVPWPLTGTCKTPRKDDLLAKMYRWTPTSAGMLAESPTARGGPSDTPPGYVYDKP